jgi:hypothetical protein
MHYFCGPQCDTRVEGPACLLSFNLYQSMKAKAFLIASLFAMSLSLTACGGDSEEVPASDMDTTTTTEAPSMPAADTTTTVTSTDTTVTSTTTTTVNGDTTAASTDTTK